MIYEVTVRYGMPGHESEWVVNINGFDLHQFIPMQISDELEEYLYPVGTPDDVTVMNRGSRIEVITEDSSEEMQRMIYRGTVLALRKDGFLH